MNITKSTEIKHFVCWYKVSLRVCVVPVRQYGYAFQAFSWILRAEAGANILTNDGTLLQGRGVKRKQA